MSFPRKRESTQITTLEWWNGRPACRQAGAQVSKMVFVYILKSLKTNYFYKGITGNLTRRLKEHNNGKVNSTRKKLPLGLVHVEVCETRNEARKMEKFLKSGYGREIIKQISAEVAELADA